MIAIYLLVVALLTIFLSFLFVRVGAIALMMTGMPQEKAAFQALSAFTRAGFTTKESELIVNHPQRRRIVTWLIILGNAGLVAIIVTATSAIATSQGYQLPITIAAILAGAFVFFLLMSRSGFNRRWEKFVENRLVKSPIFEESTTEDLLRLTEGYGVVRVMVTQDLPFVDHSLRESFPPDSQLWVVGIERDKHWISLPRSHELMKEGDRLIVYGHLSVLRSIFKHLK